MSDTYPSRLAEKIVVRLPDGMRDRLATVAKANNRSVNAEVVARLEASFDLVPLDALDPALVPSLENTLRSTIDRLEKIMARAAELDTHR